MSSMTIRGDVYAVNLRRRGAGRVKHGRRCAVVVQANDLMPFSTVVVCPTSKSAQAASFHPEVEPNGERTKVLCEMVRPFDIRAFGDRICHLSFDEIAAVDDALQLVLDLK